MNGLRKLRKLRKLTPKSSSTSRWVERKELVAARIAFGGMFLAVLVAVYGIYLVGGKC